MDFDELIKDLQKAKEDGYRKVIRANSDWTIGGGKFTLEYSEDDVGNPGDVIITLDDGDYDYTDREKVVSE